MRQFFILLTTITLISVINISAQNFAKEGIWELGGGISYSNTTTVYSGETAENSRGNFMFEVPVYYYVVDGLGLGLIPAYESNSYGDNSESLFDIFLGLAYNIATESIAYPYVEGRIGYNTYSNGDTRDGIGWVIIGGVKVQVGEGALVNIGVGYAQTTLEESGHQGERDGYNVLAFRTGFAIIIGK